MPPPASWRSALCVWLVLALLVGSCVDARDAEPRMRRAAGDAPPLTQCAACRDYGSCDLAFRGLPGQFCHTVDWSGPACCCPLDSACVPTRPSQCLCREVPAPYTNEGYSATTVVVLVAALVTTLVIIGILAARGTSSGRVGSSSSYYRRNSPTVVYQPVYAGDSGGANYGSTTTFSGDTGGSGGTFSGDTGGSGGTFSGDS